MEIRSIMRHQRQQTAAGFEEGEVFADHAVEKAQSDQDKDEERKEEQSEANAGAPCHEDEVEQTTEREKTSQPVIEEEPVPDQRMQDFMLKTQEQRDAMTCDEVFCLYLRQISKMVNESYYKQCLRFILLYRECINEYGWLKRRETY